jgi:hypothetical protein
MGVHASLAMPRQGRKIALVSSRFAVQDHPEVYMARTKPVDLDALLDESGNELSKGHGIRSLGPSDSSDTGADMVGQGPLDDTSDRNRTGERMTVGNERVRTGHDIGTDRVVGPEEAGLGDGVDEAQEAERERPQR